jgi:hypothetical protein
MRSDSAPILSIRTPDEGRPIPRSPVGLARRGPRRKWDAGAWPPRRAHVSAPRGRGRGWWERKVLIPYSYIGRV